MNALYLLYHISSWTCIYLGVQCMLQLVWQPVEQEERSLERRDLLFILANERGSAVLKVLQLKPRLSAEA